MTIDTASAAFRAWYNALPAEIRGKHDYEHLELMFQDGMQSDAPPADFQAADDVIRSR